MSTSSNHTKDFVQCCHGKHTVVSSRTLLSGHIYAYIVHNLETPVGQKKTKSGQQWMPRVKEIFPCAILGMRATGSQPCTTAKMTLHY
jgi:hypothetical protein